MNADRWQELMEAAIKSLLTTVEVKASIGKEHIKDTPRRVVGSFLEYFSGLREDPKEILRTGFTETHYSEMITVCEIEFVSICAHHLTPILGKAHFGYIPRQKIVGLSKIPRLVGAYARRPQVQEKMTWEIVDTFYKVVAPAGCGVVVDALHLCMAIRGVKQNRAMTRTTALAGCFKSDPSVKDEFLRSVGGMR